MTAPPGPRASVNHVYWVQSGPAAIWLGTLLAVTENSLVTGVPFGGRITAGVATPG
jgi:hypothetical protein